jgi:thymidylate synthase
MFYEQEDGYLRLLKNTLEDGEEKISRNGKVISKFGQVVHFTNIGKEFPLLTSKKMFFRGIVEELLWFLRGSTNAKELQEKNIHIWDSNATREYLDSVGLHEYQEGELGPVYGWQWRNFGKCYDKSSKSTEYNGIDQIKYVIEELTKDNNSRRAVLSAWNPVDLKKMALPPCHLLYIFYKNKKGLSCHMTMRSSDMFLGLPFNIASTALLTHIIAKVLHMEANEVQLSLCDAHIYEEHIDSVNQQIKRNLYDLPKLAIMKEAPPLECSIDDKIKWIVDLEYNDFVLENYECHDSIKAVIK